MVWLFRFYWLVFSIMNWIFQFSRGAGCPCKYQPNEEACMRHWYHWRRPVTYLPIFRNGKRLNPRTSMASNWNLRFLHCCRNLDLFWSFTNGSAASELSSEQGRRKFSSNWISRWVNQFSCQVLLNCLCTWDAFHNRNSQWCFWASVSFLLCTSSWQEPFGESLSRLTIDSKTMSEFTLLN